VPALRACEGGCWAIWCPACTHAHVFGPEWSWNGDRDKPTFAPSHRQWGANGECHILLLDGAIYYQQDCKNGWAGKTTLIQEFPTLTSRDF